MEALWNRPFASTQIADYWALTKPEINLMIAIATLAGFYLGRPDHLHGFQFLRLADTLLGTLLLAGGAGTLNQYLERTFDARMRRTARRPLAAGRLEPQAVLRFGILLSLAGGLYLALVVNVLASLLAAFTLVGYLAFYTPLKRRTPLCTLVGAIPGAMPPLIGWAAASGKLTLEAWLLYGILFLWQFPHVMAIAWMYRDDYARAGYLVLPARRQRERVMFWQVLLPALAIVPVSMTTMWMCSPGPVCIAALIVNLMFFYYSARLAFSGSNPAARQLLMASILYLPLILLLTVLSKP
jgi:protoheme IX farnesyltransferase